MYFHHIYIFKRALQHRYYPTLINIYHSFQNILGNEILNFLSHSGSDSKKSACKAGNLGSVPGSGRSIREGNGNPLQDSCLENPMDKEPGGLQSMELQRVGHDWLTEHAYSIQSQGGEGVSNLKSEEENSFLSLHGKKLNRRASTDCLRRTRSTSQGSCLRAKSCKNS